MDAAVELLTPLAPYAGGWAAAFVVARFALFPRRSADFGNRVVSIVHALAAIALAIPALDWSAPLAGVGGANTAAQTLCLSVSLAYFLYDLLCCLVIDPRDVVGFAHHACTIAGLAVGLSQRACGTELVACLLLMELSNPFMHLNKLLKELGDTDSTLAVANQVIFALIFFVCRLVLGPLVVRATFASPTTSVVVKAGGAGILIVSLLWFWQIAGIALHKMRKARKHAAKGKAKAR